MVFITFLSFLLIAITLTSSAVPSTYKSRDFSDRNLLMLIKRKFAKIHDSYLDDEYYKPDAEFLRSANKKCVFDKLNLIDTDEITAEDLEKFDPLDTFGDLQEDLNTLAIFVMYSCIDNYDVFITHDFANFVKKPRFQVPKNATECSKYELMKMQKGQPLIENFEGLKNMTKKQCKEILFDMKIVNQSWDIEFRGCLKIYDAQSLEYDLKFSIMNHEMPSEEIYNAEKEKFGRDLKDVNEKFVDCMIQKYIL